MDYEQFYRYLNSRPKAEISDCVRNVIELARKHSIEIDKEDRKGSKQTNDNEADAIIDHNQLSKKVWFQHAVWNRFGRSSVDVFSLKDLGGAVVSLCLEEKVSEYICDVNRSINASSTHNEKISLKPVEKVLNDSNMDQRSSHGNQSSQRFTSHQKPQSPKPLSGIKASDIESTSSWSPSSDSDLESVGGHCAPSRTKATPSKRKRQRVSSGTKLVWTAIMDDALIDAVAKYREEGWETVAKHLHFDPSIPQCQSRWSAYVKYHKQGLRTDSNWTPAEAEQLARLVPLHTAQSYWSKCSSSMTKERVDWSAIGKLLGRLPTRCRDKWKRG